MTNETLVAVRDFLESFEAVFGSDWRYTKAMLGVHAPTPEQLENQAALVRKLGLEDDVPAIADDVTFLAPGVADEFDDWGHRGLLLQRYRRLKELIEKTNATPAE